MFRNDKWSHKMSFNEGTQQKSVITYDVIYDFGLRAVRSRAAQERVLYVYSRWGITHMTSRYNACSLDLPCALCYHSGRGFPGIPIRNVFQGKSRLYALYLDDVMWVCRRSAKLPNTCAIYWFSARDECVSRRSLWNARGGSRGDTGRISHLHVPLWNGPCTGKG